MKSNLINKLNYLKEQLSDEKNLEKKAREFMDVFSKFKKKLNEKYLIEAEETPDISEINFVVDALPSFIKQLDDSVRRFKVSYNALRKLVKGRLDEVEPKKIKEVYTKFLNDLEKTTDTFRSFLTSFIGE